MAIHNMRKKGTKVMGNNGIELERDGFKSRTGFILACIGSAVGKWEIYGVFHIWYLHGVV